MAHILYPLSCLTGLIVRHRQRPSAKARAWKAPVPVLVIGNIFVGGTGKTPTVIACAKGLLAAGWKPGIVSRGYGVEIGPMPRVTPRLKSQTVDPDRFGDEPALIAQESGCPLAVHPKRKLAIESLLNEYPEVDVIISDDGLQHVEMGRDIEILVQDGRGVGNGWLLPAGPLREPVARMQTVDAIITRCDPIDKTHSGSRSSMADLLSLGPQTEEPRAIRMTLEPIRFRQLRSGQALSIPEMQEFAKGKSVGAVAGIGVPQRFFDSLSSVGLHQDWNRALPDHAQLDSGTLNDAKTDLIFITAKDAIKCRALQDPRLWVMEIEACFHDSDFWTWLDRRLTHAADQHAGRIPAR